MEKEGIFGPAQSALSWPSASSEMNWDNSVDGNAPPFESALSSMVSSPTSSDHAAPSDVIAIRELIGRLGTICGGGGGADASASCYATPLSSPPKLNLSIVGDHHHRYQQQFHLVPVAADPGFAERAARLSCFNSAGGYGGILEPGKLSRAPSSRSMKTSGSQDADQELANAREESSVSDPNSGTDSNARKRKAARKGKAKDATSSMATKMEEEEDSSVKRSRSVEMANAARNAVEPKAEQNGGGGHKEGKESLDAKPPETPKQDYIHVRARRGQATDRHSLAERVRREKISERMKQLQDLVPGCNKIIGKAVMLDEIINYVQSLQRQVEFLSMKLATLNPHLDLSVENLLQKDMHQACGPSPNSVHLLGASAAVFSYPHQPQQVVPFQCVEPTGVESQCSVNQLGFTLPPTLSLQRSSLDGFGDAVTQQGVFLENDLQSFVQMGFGQNPEAALSSQNFNGQLPPAHMKNEF